MTSLLAHGIWLPLVLGHSGVDLLDDIRTDGGLENGREGGRAPAGSAIGAVNADGRTSRLEGTEKHVSTSNLQFDNPKI